MSVGIVVPLPAYTLHPVFLATQTEALGFESLWYHEHPILPVDSASCDSAIKKRQMRVEAGEEGRTAAEQFYSLAA